MTVTLSPEQEQAISNAIEAGRFRSISDFLEVAVRHLAPPAAAAEVHQDQSALRWDGDWLVHTGRLEPGGNWESAIEDAREERIADLVKRVTP